MINLKPLIERAKKSRRKMKHLAVVFSKGNIIAIGLNNEVRHAEEQAIRQVSDKDLKGSTVLSIRVRTNGQLGNAMPCDNCHLLLKSKGVRSVIYSDTWTGAHKDFFVPQEHIENPLISYKL